ncbi:type 4b pilus protein PilO2 [Pseudomonas syringae pv. theae]|uniref:Type IV pilus protein n=1 Tax=Pseudomonas syringae pv. theae TaxID=103985 RepID=A0A3M5N237_PSESX|nr:type 4b pilus protein PilO2 [Pseudomonas syringae]MBL3875272.1 pilus assembly protein PilO [Pseudomonas syringae pv. theae]RMT65596.1 Type IV pilus protein [Pseudomonas syringae pv. theae]GKQ31543.1 type 4b pilus protein PilO2 [Pseudomonas syringae pv. theae]
MANPFSKLTRRAARVPVPSDGKVQILTYHGRSFVTGLLWHPLGSLTGYMKEARQFGRAQQMDIVAIRHTESVIQAGFVSQNDGAVKGMYSLAASLAGQLGPSWLAAWKIENTEDRYALVAVFRGAVIPGADLVGSRDEINRKVAQQLSRSMSFDKVFLPQEFGRGGEPFDVEALLHPSNLKREYKLTPLAFGLSTQELVRVAALGAVVVGCLIGWHQWQDHKQQLAREAQRAAEAARQAELDALNQRTNSPVVIEALVHPWVKQPSVPAFLEGCNGAIDQLPLAIAGWLFVSAKCDGAFMSASYRRAGNSTAIDFNTATAGHFADTPAFYDEGNMAALKLTFELPLAGDDSLDPATHALDSITSWLQAQNLQPKITEVPVTTVQLTALPGQPAPPPPPPPDYRHFEIRYTSVLPPATVLQGVKSTGMRLREIKTELQGGQLTWNVIGDLYVH